MPPKSPARNKTYGNYCFRATCAVTDTTMGCPVAKVKGYDRTPEIGKDTEHMCRVHARTMGPHYVCGDAEVVMLSGSDVSCMGEFFVVMDGTVKRLV